jgi:hypothetical protein
VPNPLQAQRQIYKTLKDHDVLIVVIPSFATWNCWSYGASWKWLRPKNGSLHSRRKPLPGWLSERVSYHWLHEKKAAIMKKTFGPAMDPSIFEPFLPQHSSAKSFLKLEIKNSPGSEQLAGR